MRKEEFAMHEKFMRKRIEVLSEKEKQMIEEHGWVFHYVYETKGGELNGLANIHTHGIEENFQHKDIQVVLPIMAQTIHSILAGIVGDSELPAT